MNLTIIIALALIFLGGIGAILLVVGQAQSSAADKKDLVDLTKSENAQLKIRLHELEKERKSLKEDLEIRDNRIKSQTDTIIELNNQLVNKSDYISDYLIGGKGFPIIYTSSLKTVNPTQDEKITFTLANEQPLPLYDVTVTIYDWNYMHSKFFKMPGEDLPSIQQQDFKRSILRRFDETQMFQNSEVITKDKYDMHDGLLYIQLKCRSAFVFEKMAFIKIGNLVYEGFLVYDANGKTLKEWIAPGTPDPIRKALRNKFKLIPDQVTLRIVE